MKEAALVRYVHDVPLLRASNISLGLVGTLWPHSPHASVKLETAKITSLATQVTTAIATRHSNVPYEMASPQRRNCASHVATGAVFLTY